MVSQKTYAWKLPKRFRTNDFVIKFFRTLQKRFYIESFATNLFSIAPKNSILPFLPLLSLLLGSLPSCCFLYSFDFLYHPYFLIPSTHRNPFTFFTLPRSIVPVTKSSRILQERWGKVIRSCRQTREIVGICKQYFGREFSNDFRLGPSGKCGKLSKPIG